VAGTGRRPDRPPVQGRASLDGEWAFWPDIERLLPTGPGAPFVSDSDRRAALGQPRAARVPAPWQALFDDLRGWSGTGWYERELTVPVGSGRARLGFESVDYFATVWVNGQLAGEHEGGYLPFSLDVTDLLSRDRPNVVTIRVLDVGPGDEDGPFSFSEIPHGKQSWYGPIGGLWRPTWIERRGRTFVDAVRIAADPRTGEVSAAARLAGELDDRTELRWRIRGPDGSVVAAGRCRRGDTMLRTRVPEVLSWHPDTPNLYELVIELVAGDERTDRWDARFGFRTVAVEDGRVVLNGEPVYLLGALDQDYWMPGISTAATDEEIHHEMIRAKELGLNLLRCHIKPPDPRYLDAADTAGLLVWCEPPSWITLTEASKRRVRETLAGMIDRDVNHPSFVIIGIVNEDWGTDLANEAEHRAWLRETCRWVRSLDPTRLVVDNSACPPTFHVDSDLNDYHLYRAVPEQIGSWRAWTRGWVADPARTYSPHADAAYRGSEPLVLSEFGLWGLPDPAALFDEDGRPPWWFETGRDHSDGIVLPAGVRERFEESRLDEIFGSFEAFIRASQEHQFEGLKLQIEDVRLHDEIAGYVITEFTDVHWEANGLLDMRRRPKVFHRRSPSVNAPDLVIARPERARCRAGDTVVVDLWTIGPRGRVDGRVDWDLAGFEIGGAARSGERIRFTAPSVPQPTRTLLTARWSDAQGAVVSRTEAPVWLFPAEESSRHPGVVVATRWTDVADAVAAGGRAVLVADDDLALPPGGTVRSRPLGSSDASGPSASVYGDGWVLSTGMGWLSPALAEGLAVGPRVDLAFEGIAPRFVLDGDGREPFDVRADLLAGHHLGWLHRLRPTVAGFRHGDGALIVCTFPLLELDRVDPLATALLDRLTAIAGDAGFAPRTIL
jgi:Glycosyl hydrolases family 2, sugar binding domain/Glycosyl hydrolases family 2, TIM barrel domain/Glycosyl hydrolases family 2